MTITVVCDAHTVLQKVLKIKIKQSICVKLCLLVPNNLFLKF